MSEKYQQRPSALLNLERNDPYAAYCLDEACYLWGSHVDSELELASHDPKDLNKKEVKSAMNRRQQVFKRMMDTPDSDDERQLPRKPAPGAFKDPASFIKKKE